MKLQIGLLGHTGPPLAKSSHMPVPAPGFGLTMACPRVYLPFNRTSKEMEERGRLTLRMQPVHLSLEHSLSALTDPVTPQRAP